MQLAHREALHMVYRTNAEIRQEVEELFYMYDYLYTHIEEDYIKPNDYLITYDVLNDTDARRKSNILHDLITNVDKDRLVGDKILRTPLGGTGNGIELTTPTREKMLKVYRELKTKDDFNDPAKAQEYAKKIVEVAR